MAKDKLDKVLRKLEEHDEKFERVFDKLEEHDKRFDQVDKKFDQVDKRFEEVATNFDRVFGELEKVREDRLFALAKDRELEYRVDSLDKRVKVLETSRT